MTENEEALQEEEKEHHWKKGDALYYVVPNSKDDIEQEGWYLETIDSGDGLAKVLLRNPASKKRTVAVVPLRKLNYIQPEYWEEMPEEPESLLFLDS